MKKTQFTDLITTILNTIVSFSSIVVFIALGLAFYGGTAWSIDNTEMSFTRTYQEGKMQSLLVTDPLGLTEDQIAEMKNISGIDDAEGCNIVYRFFHRDGVRQQAALWTLTERTDLLLNIDGELPRAAGQAAVLRSWAEENGIQIGDIIEFEDSDASDYREMKIVRTVAQWDGEDINNLSEAACTDDCITEKSLTVTAIVDSPVYLSNNPYAHGTCSANGMYIDAVFFVTEDEIPSWDSGAYTSVILYSKDLNTTNCFSDEYKKRSDELCNMVQLAVDDYDKKLLDTFGSSVDNLRKLLDGITSKTGLKSSDGESLYAGLDMMREELDGKDSFCCVEEIVSNNSYLTAESLIKILKSLQSVLGITFLAVGVLICYSVVSRLVGDSAVQMGTRRALGFYKSDILVFYLSYVITAVLLGGILGTVIGVFVIESLLVKVYDSLFTLTGFPLICNIEDILPVFLIVLITIIAATTVSCISKTRKNVIALLRGEQENPGKFTFLHKFPFFRNMPLLKQTVLLNLMQDKQRVFGMIIGIAGATALMTAGFSLYLNFTTAFSKQFTDYYLFDYQICYDPSSVSASQEIQEILDSHNLKYAELYSSIVVINTPDGGTNAPCIIVPMDTEDLAQIMLFDTQDATGTSYDGGVWMSDYYLYSFDAPVGSLLSLQTLDGKKADVPVDRYYKFHLTTPVIVMDNDTYLRSFGVEAAPNTFYIDSGGMSIEELDSKLQRIDGYISVYNFYESHLDSFNTEKLVVTSFAALFTVMAVLMALMIIINLISVYISEKKYELIILMINGYGSKFAKGYIYQDTVVLTVIGILIGLIAGSILGDQTLAAIETDSLRMLHGISFLACAIASAAVAGLTALICIFTLRSVDKLKLSDINRI